MEKRALGSRLRLNKPFCRALEVVRWPATSSSKVFSATTASVLLVVLLVGTIASTRWIGVSTFAGVSFQRLFRPSPEYPLRDEYLLNCTTTNMTLTCPANYPPQGDSAERLSHHQCPDYFRWIHEDLKPWKQKGITLEMVESAKQFAHFRLVIVNGTAYVNQYGKAFQTRDVLTLWGILQLLKLYPGRLPDLDLMFQCHDPPLIKKDQYMESNATEVPLLFHFCGSDSTFDIVFPDWSFWGWPETNIKPWVPLMKDIKKGNRKINWTNREPYAYWKGSLFMGTRGKLKNCNSTKDWHAAIYHQDWFKETAEGFNNSDLSKQCSNRYKIYIEGIAWSVSNKYVLACDSMTLQVNPTFYEFFTRSLVPLKHYWPINDHPDQICKSIKFAVEWGNSHIEKAQEIGQEGSKFIMEHMSIENIYDYMFHVLKEYGMLLRYKPTIPSGAVELCSEKWGCGPNGLEHMYRLETMVEGPAQRNPCAMPPPYSPLALQELLDQNAKIKRQVEEWEFEGSQ